jgi:hypothetical protein
MDLIIAPDGTACCLYAEELDLSQLGRLTITRASHVEPTEDGHWTADLSPIGGPVLSPFPRRCHALGRRGVVQILADRTQGKPLGFDRTSP